LFPWAWLAPTLAGAKEFSHPLEKDHAKTSAPRQCGSSLMWVQAESLINSREYGAVDDVAAHFPIFNAQGKSAWAAEGAETA
jgi:hypothetical protein